MSNCSIRDTKDMMQHTCHTRKGGEKSISGSPNTEQTHGQSSGLVAVLPGLSTSSPLKPWGPRGWEYGQLMKLQCHCLPAKIFEALSFPTFTQGTSFWWVPFLFTCTFLKSPTSSLQRGWEKSFQQTEREQKETTFPSKWAQSYSSTKLKSGYKQYTLQS